MHNDFKLDNVLLHPDRFTPVAVVDWDMCTRGCPLYDLAILLSYWTEPDDHPVMHLLRQMPSAAPGFPGRAEVLDAYARRSGIDIGDFRFYRALSVFRLAIVFRQLVNLYRRGVRTSPEFGRSTTWPKVCSTLPLRLSKAAGTDGVPSDGRFRQSRVHACCLTSPSTTRA